ncbi:MAG TPA: Uma2 family endonuclease [Thermoanaerobaculia bacterium]|nr:Uma2 family endonuclease [Thermoanaerobaculia bacterium]
MSQPTVAALALPLDFELVFSDGEPLETEWHSIQLPFLRELILQLMKERGRRDSYVGGDMFMYYSVEQAREVAEGQPYLRGPDVFWVESADPDRERQGWVAWEEGGRLPDVIIELSSPATAEIDHTVKRTLYSQIFRTSEYYIYQPNTRKLEGFRLADRFYQAMKLDAQGRLWSDRLGAFLGLWHGIRENQERDWVRLYRADGSLVLSGEEQAEVERQRAKAAHHEAEAAHHRAEAAEAELARLRALLQGRSTRV